MKFSPREVIEKHLENGAASAKPTLNTSISDSVTSPSTSSLPREPTMPTMTITRPTMDTSIGTTRPTMDTSIGTTRPTMGTSWLQKSQTRTEVRMTQEEYRRQEVRQTLDKVSKVEKVDKVAKMEMVETNTGGKISREASEAFAEERGSWTMTVTDHLLKNSQGKDSRFDADNHLDVEEEAAKRREAESEEMRKREEEEKRKQLQQDLEVRRQAQFEEERRLKEEEEVRKAKEEETRRAIEEETRLRREEVEKNLIREREASLKREELANQTLLQTSTPKKEEDKHLVVSRQEISEEERQEMLRERQEFLRIPKQEMEMEMEEEEEFGRTRKYFITQQEIVFYVKVEIIGAKIMTKSFISKDSEGVVRIIHRPLLKREEVKNTNGCTS